MQETVGSFYSFRVRGSLVHFIRSVNIDVLYAVQLTLLTLLHHPFRLYLAGSSSITEAIQV